MPETSRPPSLLVLFSYLASQAAKGPRLATQRLLADHELTTQEFGVLTALGDLGALSQQQLANHLDADKSQVMRLIDRLEDRGFLARSTDPSDRRRHAVELTSQGRRRLEKVAPLVANGEAEQLRALSAAEQRTLADLLRRVLETPDSA